VLNQQNLQERKPDRDPNLADPRELFLQELVSSSNEQYGDALKELSHHGDDLPIAAIQTSKYTDRLLYSAERVQNITKIGTELESNKRMREANVSLRLAEAWFEQVNAPNLDLRKKPEKIDGARDKVLAELKKIPITSVSDYKELLGRINVATTVAAKNFARHNSPGKLRR
jgi:hypothetical protein